MTITPRYIVLEPREDGTFKGKATVNTENRVTVKIVPSFSKVLVDNKPNITIAFEPGKTVELTISTTEKVGSPVIKFFVDDVPSSQFLFWLTIPEQIKECTSSPLELNTFKMIEENKKKIGQGAY